MFNAIYKPLSAGVVILSLVGCGGDKISITSPDENGVYSTSTSDTQVTITYSGIETSELVLLLNGADVTSQFVVGDTEAVATLADLSASLVDGENDMAVSAPEEHSVDFIWDISGPVVHITSVETCGDCGPAVVSYSGYIEDYSAVTEISLNGSETIAVAEDKTFTWGSNSNTANFSDSARLSFSAEDSFGFSSTTDIEVSDDINDKVLGDSASLKSGIGARINDSGLNFIEDEAVAVISTIDLESVLLAQNPLVYESKELKECVWGICVSLGSVWVRVNAEWLSLGTISLEVVPRNNSNVVDVTATLDSISIGLDPDAHTPGIDYGLFDVTVTADDVTAAASLALDSANDGGVAATLQSMNINLDIDLGALESALNTVDTVLDVIGLGGLTNTVKDAINGVVEDQLESQLGSMLPDLLEQYTQLVPTGATVAILGKNLVIEGEVDSFSGSSGALTAVVNTGAHAETIESTGLGSLYDSTAMPSLGFSTTPDGSSFHVGAVVSNNILNRALLAAFEAGVMNVDELVYSATDLSEVLGDALAGEDQISVAVSPASAPAVTLTGSGELLSLAIQDMTLVVSLKPAGSDTSSMLFETTVNASVPVSVGVSGDSKLDVAIETLPTFSVLSMNVLGLTLSTDQATSLVDWVLPNVMPYLAEGIASIAIPTIEGYTFAPVELWQANSGYLGLAGNMVSGVQASSLVTASADLSASGADTMSAMRVSLGSSTVTSGEQVTFSVAGSDEDGESVQTRYRLDGGAWSTWKQRDDVTLYRVLTGDHSLEVCARDAELAESSDCAEEAFTIAG
ncbi:hypothetical protein A9Q99_16775 [Gammaproteobacteria bacterium 45_16_T64]|nr:hypothetical protein A9Q99_16775 [Gammaproteobacteria bacterium 45_16_T64]